MDVGIPTGEIDTSNIVEVTNPSGNPSSKGYYEYSEERGYFRSTDSTVVLGKTYYIVKLGKGQWSWKVHEYNGENNLYLKWLG